jgi:hypothetical protein
MNDEVNLPDGIIDSPELYFAAIREKAAMDPQLVDDAIRVLEEEFLTAIRKIDLDFSKNERRYRMAYFTGALLGARISWKRFVIYLKNRAWEDERKAQGDLPTPPPAGS